MQKQDTKISNLFKEKKKSNRKILVKDSLKDIFSQSDKKILTLLNKKRNKTDFYPTSDKNKNKKEKIKEENISSLKPNNNNNNSIFLFSSSQSQTTGDSQYFGHNDIFNNNSNKEECLINNEEDEYSNINNNKLLEISSETKKLLNKIMTNKKKENGKKKIIDQYNLEQNTNNNTKINKNVNIDKYTNKKVDPPKLSLKTIEIIKKLKDDRKNRFEYPQNNDEEFHCKSSFSSLHLKYDELISKKRELRLPIKYKELLNAFNSLEHIINLNKIRSPYKINTFENIKKSIEEMTHHTFNMKIFQQILYIVPHFYILKYVKKSDLNKNTFKLNDEGINKQYDLAIEIPKDYKERMHSNYDQNFNFLKINYFKENDKNFSPNYTSINIINLKKREEIFRNILNLIVNIFHQKFIRENNIVINFNPIEHKTWHHKFDPDKECNDIPLFEIPMPPENTSIFQSTIMKNDIKHEIMEDALSIVETTNNNNEKDINNNEKDINNNKNKNKNKKIYNKYVSQLFLNKLRAKEKANNIINEINNYNLYHNNLKDMNNIYKEILMQMKTILIVNKNIHKLIDISELLINSNQSIKECFYNVEKLAETILKLCKKIEGFISVKNHSYLGPVVVLENKDFKIPDTIILDN